MNQGAIALKARIEELGLGQNDAARRVEADSGNFSRIVNGTALPGRKVAANILREYGIASELFDQQIAADGKAAP